MIWSAIFGFGKNLISKITWKSVLAIGFLLLLGYLITMSKNFITGLTGSLSDLRAQNTTLLEQNSKVIQSNKENAKAYIDFKKDVELSDAITETLIKKVEGIQNVKITEKTIIQTAKSNCLDQPYPNSIINSGVLRWNEETTATTEDSNTGKNN